MSVPGRTVWWVRRCLSTSWDCTCCSSIPPPLWCRSMPLGWCVSSVCVSRSVVEFLEKLRPLQKVLRIMQTWPESPASLEKALQAEGSRGSCLRAALGHLPNGWLRFPGQTELTGQIRDGLLKPFVAVLSNALCQATSVSLLMGLPSGRGLDLGFSSFMSGYLC